MAGSKLVSTARAESIVGTVAASTSLAAGAVTAALRYLCGSPAKT
jgi:hypothetical protein